MINTVNTTNQTVNNFLSHQEEVRQKQLQKEIRECEANQNCSAEELADKNAENIALNDLDIKRDHDLNRACFSSAGNSACRRETLKLAAVVQSYKEVLDSREIYKDGTYAEYLDSAIKFANANRDANVGNTRAAVINMSVESAEAALQLAVIGTMAAAGNEEAQIKIESDC